MPELTRTVLGMTQSTWKSGVGEFEEAVHELRRSGHALQEAVEELTRFSEQGDYARLHFQKGLSAIGLAEQRISLAKRKLESFKGKDLFDRQNASSPKGVDDDF